MSNKRSGAIGTDHMKGTVSMDGADMAMCRWRQSGKRAAQPARVTIPVHQNIWIRLPKNTRVSVGNSSPVMTIPLVITL